MPRRTLIWGLCLTLLATACGSKAPTGPGPITNPPPDTQPPPPPPPPPPTLGITKILCFGDSMTAGTTSAVYTPTALTPGSSTSYPFKLQGLLAARYTAQTIAVSNAGKPGEKAVEGKNRLGGALSEAKPEFLILMEGANDLNSPDFTSVSPIVGAMEDMVREALGRGVQVAVATLPPQREDGPKAARPGLVTKYNSELRAMAAKKGATLVDVNALFPVSLIGQDGLHPTEEGYQRLAEIFQDAIKAKYEVTSSALR